MAEYLIKEESLVEIADAVRTHFKYYDGVMGMLTDKKNLASITIPDDITRIGKCGLAYSGLTNVIIPDSVQVIDNSAFADCNHLTSIILGQYTLSIDRQAFSYCTELTNIAIPSTCMTIGYNAFRGCNNLTDIYMHSITPPTLANTEAIPSTTTIHVPIGSGDAYKTATNWSSFANKIVADGQTS